MQRQQTMSGKKQPDAVADKVLKRVEIRKMARLLQNRLRLAEFKTTHGWEDLPLDKIEPKLEEQIRRKIRVDDEVLSDSSSASDLPYPTRTLMSSPLKALYSDAIASSNGSTGHRKRTYDVSFEHVGWSPSKRLRSSPMGHKSFTPGYNTWKQHHQLAQSSPIKPRRQQHFTTSTGPNVSLAVPNYAAPSDEDDDLLPAHSFHGQVLRSSPPSTPPMRRRTGPHGPNSHEHDKPAAPSGEEGVDLLMYLAATPSPAVKKNMDPPSTPPPRNKMGLPSSMMTTPGGGGNPYQSTPAFDFSDFVHMTPSPAQKTWKTPVTGGKTPLGISRKRLTFDDMP